MAPSLLYLKTNYLLFSNYNYTELSAVLLTFKIEKEQIIHIICSWVNLLFILNIKKIKITMEFQITPRFPRL